MSPTGIRSVISRHVIGARGHWVISTQTIGYSSTLISNTIQKEQRLHMLHSTFGMVHVHLCRQLCDVTVPIRRYKRIKVMYTVISVQHKMCLTAANVI